MDANVTQMVDSILGGAAVRDVIAQAASAVGDPTAVEEGTITKKVVRNGKVVKKKFRTHKVHKVLSAAQKKAIKKAQKASKKATAIFKRKKSLKKAATLEGVDQNEDIQITCPLCGSDNMEICQDEETGAIVFVCQDCGKEFSLVDNEALADMIEDDNDEDDSDVEIDIEGFTDDENAEGAEPVEGEAEGDEGVPTFFEG